jgi:hypothetical protein
MNWFTWRQLRKQFLIFGLLLALFAALVIPTGIHYWHTYQEAVATCVSHPATPSCKSLQDALFNTQADGFIRIAVVLGTFGLPILLGLFIGAPLLAREYEEGTNKLAWTQSVSRRKWLTIKLLWALGFALLYGVALAAFVTWWSHTLNSLNHFRFVQGHFETQGLMPVAYSLFFTAVGFTVGAWFRKTLLAFGITFGVFVVCMASFANWIRPHYMQPVTVKGDMGPGVMSKMIPEGAWILKTYIVDKNGKVTNDFSPQNMPEECQSLTQNMNVSNSGAAHVKVTGSDPVDDCLNEAGYRQAATFQPSYRYWDFQRVEAGIYLGMTVLVSAGAYWLVLKRDA